MKQVGKQGGEEWVRGLLETSFHVCSSFNYQILNLDCRWQFVWYWWICKLQLLAFPTLCYDKMMMWYNGLMMITINIWLCVCVCVCVFHGLRETNICTKLLMKDVDYFDYFMWIIFVIFHFPSFYVLAPCFLFWPCHRCLLLVRLQSPLPCGLKSSRLITPFPTFTLLFISMAPISYLFALGCHSTLFYLIYPLLPLLDVTHR